MNIYSFEPFGYEGSLVTVEVDLRRGIPAVDIVGLADGAVREMRERAKSAIKNSGYEFPMERILISLSPADLKKENAMHDLAITTGIIAENEKENFINEKVLVIGEVELSGRIRSVRAVHAAVSSAFSAGIRYAVVPKENLLEAKEIKGMKICGVENLSDAMEALKDEKRFVESKNIEENETSSVSFLENDEVALSDGMELPENLVRAIEIAVAGKHSLIAVGRPGCGKTLAIQSLIPTITPNLTFEESQSVTRIHSIAGLMRADTSYIKVPSFRIPHQTSSIEGMCGGGLNCRPGEVSLAHNGFLFLDEAAEFRSSVLQMLRVPLENGTITLCRAGRSTVYPAKFQLIMATNPCPCGNYGSKERICLCSEKSIQQYWSKFSAPLIDRICVICFVSDDEKKIKVNLSELRKHIKQAFEAQRKFGTYNNYLSPQELLSKFNADKESEEILDSYIKDNSVSVRRAANIRKIALTIANMEGRENVFQEDVREAISYSKPFHSEL